ncbi:unnamed protein product [Ranitomeya imitator]|uniref:Uncharacterized protein n=1 Tax=Ranitomeya imitator TaxID=111125 RepID=A0ABN9MFC0_9NEOB|nr:unnamed protein product [Ranitomeya imitator]
MTKSEHNNNQAVILHQQGLSQGLPGTKGERGERGDTQSQNMVRVIARQDHQGHLADKVLQEHLEKWGHLERQDFLEVREVQEHPEKEVSLVKREKGATQAWELKAHEVHRDLQDPQEKVELETKDPSGNRDNVDCQVHKEILVHRDLPGHQDIAMLLLVLDMVDMAVTLAKEALNPMAQEVLMMMMTTTTTEKILMVDTKCPTPIPTPILATTNRSLHGSKRKIRWR